MILFMVLVVCATARRNIYPLRDNNLDSDEKFKEIWLQEKMFPPLKNMVYHAARVKESSYPWIARVVHSTTSYNPHMCTASCISFGIFITAATCVASLKIEHTSVIYGGHWLRMKAMVISANMSQQGYDDIGFLIGYNTYYVKWHTVPLFDQTNRTDDHFEWFSKIYNTDDRGFSVLGFSTTTKQRGNYFTDVEYYLEEMSVVVNFDLCPKLYPRYKTDLYNVPCFNSCGADKYYFKKGIFKTDEEYCTFYHQVFGSALIEKKNKKLLGVSTWSGGEGIYHTPTGFAVPNSDSFFKNYRCAIKIRDDKVGLKPGHYQSLCKN